MALPTDIPKRVPVRQMRHGLRVGFLGTRPDVGVHAPPVDPAEHFENYVPGELDDPSLVNPPFATYEILGIEGGDGSINLD